MRAATQACRHLQFTALPRMATWGRRATPWQHRRVTTYDPKPSADGDGDRDGCAVCGEMTPARPGGSQLVDGRRLVREIGSCRRCGLQLVRFDGEAWREIRG